MSAGKGPASSGPFAHHHPMPYSYTNEGRIVHVSWLGLVTKEDLVALVEDMPRIGRELGLAPDVLHTFAAVTGHSFQPIAAYMYSLLQKRVEIPNPIRAAIVATTPEGEALAKVFKTLNRTHNLEMKVFGNEAAARRWLARP